MVLPFMLTACAHKSHQIASQPLAPPIVDTPPPNPAPPPAELPPPVVTVPGQTTAPQNTAQTQPPEETPKPKVHHKKPAPTTPTRIRNKPRTRPPRSAQSASFRRAIPPICNSRPNRRSPQLNAVLSEITRKLNDQEQKTAAQIREFIKQAKAALASSDVDGAHTLAVKAKVLLGEITTQ